MVLGMHSAGMAEHCPICDARLEEYDLINSEGDLVGKELDCPFSYSHAPDKLAETELPIELPA